MKLAACPVLFDEAAHTYTDSADGKVLGGVTPIVAWMFPQTYGGVPQAVLARAAERGHKVHEACQVADDFGILPDDAPSEARDYLRLCKEHGMESIANEYLVWDGRDIASSIDVVARTGGCADGEVVLLDIKTTSEVHHDNVRLQLSIYAFLFEMMNPALKVRGLYVAWLPKPQYGQPALIETAPRVPSEDCREIIRAYLAGEDSAPYRERLFPEAAAPPAAPPPAGDAPLPAEVRDAEAEIIRLETALRSMKEKKEKLQAGLLELMRENGVKRYETPQMVITYVAPSERERFDTKRLSFEHPDIYKEYLASSPVGDGVRIKIKSKPRDIEITD